jgi:hypothetical protein
MATIVLGAAGRPKLISDEESSFLGKEIKSIESVCSDLIAYKEKFYDFAFSTEAFNAGETIKKTITWIAEKIKALINAIKGFIEKVSTFIKGDQHTKAAQFKDDCVKKLTVYFPKYRNVQRPVQTIENVLDTLVNEDDYANMYVAKEWVSSGSRKSEFEYAYRHIEKLMASSLPSNDSLDSTKDEINENMDRITKAIHSMKEDAVSQAQKLVQDKTGASILELFKSYDTLVTANIRIDHLSREINAALAKADGNISVLLRNSNSNTQSGSGKDDSTYKQVNYLQTLTGALSKLTSLVTYLTVIKTIVRLDRTIIAIHQVELPAE